MNRRPYDHPWLQLRISRSSSANLGPGTWAVELDGRLCRTDEQFFHEAARALDFPANFGHNWDAFDECFGDLLDVTEGGMGNAFGGRVGRPGDGLDLTIDHAEYLLTDGWSDALRVLLEILREDLSAVDRPDGVHRYADLRVTFVCAPDAMTALDARLSAAGMRQDDLIS